MQVNQTLAIAVTDWEIHMSHHCYDHAVFGQQLSLPLPPAKPTSINHKQTDPHTHTDNSTTVCPNKGRVVSTRQQLTSEPPADIINTVFCKNSGRQESQFVTKSCGTFPALKVVPSDSSQR